MSGIIAKVRDAATHQLADLHVFDDLTKKANSIPWNLDSKGLKVIGAGYSRTATLSMYAAFMELGYKTYHGTEMAFTPGIVERWQRVLEYDLKHGNTKGINWEEIVQGYEAGFDGPFADYWLELSQAFPDAKIIYTRRDGQAWLNSYYTAVIKPMTHNFWHRLACIWFPHMAKVMKVALLLQRKYVRDYGGSFAMAGLRPELIEERLEKIKKVIPPERLLIFHPSEGYAPICKFLDIPEPPSSQFPKINDGPSMVWIAHVITIIGLSFWAIAIALPVGLAVWWIR